MSDEKTTADVGMKSPGNPPPPSTWRYRTWAGHKVTVTAHWLEFERGYVVFRDNAGRIVHAEDHQNVHQLSEDGHQGEVTGR